jgi:hypothetical protein
MGQYLYRGINIHLPAKVNSSDGSRDGFSSVPVQEALGKDICLVNCALCDSPKKRIFFVEVLPPFIYSNPQAVS